MPSNVYNLREGFERLNSPPFKLDEWSTFSAEFSEKFRKWLVENSRKVKF